MQYLLKCNRYSRWISFGNYIPSVQLLNPDEDIFVVCDRVVVSSASITSEVVPPLNLLLWNHSRLTPIQGEVSKFPYPINSFMEYLFLQEYVDFIQKHPLKNKHGNKPVVIAPIVLYSDDTSGNRSKKWNKFDCWCLSMAGLPIRDARKIENIHFMYCSNQVSAMEIAIPLADDLTLCTPQDSKTSESDLRKIIISHKVRLLQQ